MFKKEDTKKKIYGNEETRKKGEPEKYTCLRGVRFEVESFKYLGAQSSQWKSEMCRIAVFVSAVEK